MTGPVPPSWAVDPAEARAFEVVPGLWGLRLPVPWEAIGHVNAYAIESEDGIVLVDCGGAGDPTCVLALERALAAAGRRVEEVTQLVLTHVHSDHAGLASLVRERSGAPVLAHPDDAHFYDARREPERIAAKRRERARREGVPAERLEAFATVREEVEGVLATVAPDRALREGDVVSSRLGAWRVLETPGHAPSHICLVQEEAGIAIAGDLLCRRFVPWLDYGYSPDPAAELLGSLDRFVTAPYELALPGHGRPLSDPGLVAAEHRELLGARIAAVRAALAAQPSGAYELATRIHGDAADIAAVAHLCETLAYLLHLRRLGEVERLELPDGSYVYAPA